MYNGSSYAYFGQSFSNTSASVLNSCRFKLQKSASPTGYIYVNIYAHTGTYGTTGLPTGSALATSDGVDASTISTTATEYTFTFSGTNKINLSASTYYCLVAFYTGGSSTNKIRIYFYSSGTINIHPGIAFYSANGSTWTKISTPAYSDCRFYVYGDDAAASTASPFMPISY